MKKMNPTLGAITLAVMASFVVTGCQNKTEEAAEVRADALENQADAVREAGEVRADALEDSADRLDTRTDGVDTPAEQAVEKQAEAVREGTEKTADAIENKADAVRDAAK